MLGRSCSFLKMQQQLDVVCCSAVESAESANGQVVFHARGDCGSTRSPQHQNEVTDKLVSDFHEMVQKEVPRFLFMLGDVVYSFGEARYCYDRSGSGCPGELGRQKLWVSARYRHRVSASD